jgi:hypothetical protein
MLQASDHLATYKADRNGIVAAMNQNDSEGFQGTRPV